jgi:phage baseplate assembly protein W
LYDYVEITEQGGAIALKEKLNLGKESWIRVSGKGAGALGFVQKGSRGDLLYPGWSLVKEETIIPSSLNPRSASTRKVVFNSALRGNPDLKLSYTTLPSLCKRCRATFVENDYRFNPLGDILTVEDENLLLQACLKSVLTEKGSNPFHVSYGSKIKTRIGNKIVGAAAALVREDVVRALQTVKSLQAQQREFQSVTSKELLVSISSVDVNIDPKDPTLYFVDVIVRNGSNQPVSISITYTAPGAVALTGSNGQSLGTQRVGV